MMIIIISIHGHDGITFIFKTHWVLILYKPLGVIRNKVVADIDSYLADAITCIMIIIIRIYDR